MLLLCLASEARAETRLELVTGAGSALGEVGVWVEPRLAHEGTTYGLHVRAPLVISWEDGRRRPRAAMAYGLRGESPLDSYGGVLERLWLRGHGFELAVESDAPLTLGEGQLFDGLRTSLDPFSPRPSLSLGWRGRSGGGRLALPDVTRAGLAGLRVQGQPLRAFGLDRHALVRGGLEVATVRGQAIPWLAWDLALTAWRGRSTGLRLVVSGGAHGARHRGLELRLSFEGRGSGTTVRMDLGYWRSRGRYLPGFFDAAYAVERETAWGAVPSRRALPGGRRTGLRLSTRLVTGRLDAGLSMKAWRIEDEKRANLQGTIGYGGDELRVALLVMQRFARFPAEALRLRPGLWLQGGIGWRLGGPFGLFASLTRGLYEDRSGAYRPETRWLIGVGAGWKTPAGM